KSAQDDYDKVKTDAARARTAGQLAAKPPLVSVISRPSRPAPSDPHRPILWLNVLIAVAGGLIVALIYAFTADHFDHTIKSIDDAERYLGMPVLASIPKLGRRIIRTK
ncbi:MAG: hypothetical protein KAU28_06905, partial [Phycisphaerae bacterium]|nr:hypothetical protein [Phycisphaerae bacterium]